MGTLTIEPLRILDRRFRQLRNRPVDQVKVQWDKHSPGSTTWEDAKTLRRDYPSLFLPPREYVSRRLGVCNTTFLLRYPGLPEAYTPLFSIHQ